MLAGLAWGVGFLMSQKLSSGKEKYLNVLLSLLFFCSWIGAKVFFLLTSSHIDKEAFLKSSNFWLGGGFVFYGGLIFGLTTFLVFLKTTKQKAKTFSHLTVPLGIGHGLGRVGCFMAGCCHGTELSVVKYVTHIPVQLFEAIGLFFIAYRCLIKVKENKDTILFYLKSYSILRFSLEFLRGDSIRGFYLGLSSSQLISLTLLFIAILFEYKIKKTKTNLSV